MTNDTTAGADIVADAREWLANHSGRVTTHGDECHRWHDACLIARLVEECERLRLLSEKRDYLTPENPVNGDIVARLRDWRSVHLARLHLLMEEAADEMARVISDNKLRADLGRGLTSEIAGLRQAIRRLADQDATLSVQGGSVIVTVDATLTDAEREAVESCIADDEAATAYQRAATLRELLDRMSPLAT